jgi:hypothetical protein
MNQSRLVHLAFIGRKEARDLVRVLNFQRKKICYVGIKYLGESIAYPSNL